MCSSFVYIVASSKNGQVFTGTTTDLVHQVWLHRKGAMADAGAPAACTRLVWHQAFDTPQEATAQLERLARWPQAWIDRLIEEDNPQWSDLWARLDDQPVIGLSPAFNAQQETPQPRIHRPRLHISSVQHTPTIRPMRSVA